MLIGILAGVATGALWGLSFVAPRAVEPFSTWDFTVVRYGIFGLASLLLLAHPRFRPVGMGWRRVGIGLLLGAGGYIGFFISVAYAVRLAGAVIPPLIVGLLPVVLAMIANGRQRSLPWRELALPLAFILAGMLLVNVAASAAGAERRADLLLGILFSLAALGSWVFYGLLNAEVMRAPAPPDAMRWTCLQGLGTLFGCLVVLPMTTFLQPGGADWAAFATPGGVRFLVWAVMMGLAGTWLATWFWTQASRRLPLAFSAQLIVTETVFGLVYGLVYEQRLPTLTETMGVVLQLAGVAMAIALFTRRARLAEG
ncbi:MAG TPA: DMT family transporter [Xanthobacteraceae bacterium]|nr:DMT family transporter [Xanthobacteraceae bacterium]